MYESHIERENYREKKKNAVVTAWDARAIPFGTPVERVPKGMAKRTRFCRLL